MAISQTLPGVTPQISPLGTSPVAQQATNFFGPIATGTATGTGDAPSTFGSPLLAYRFDITFRTGNFNGNTPGAQIVLPPGSILYRFVSVVSPVFNGTTPALNYGTTPTGAQIAVVDLAVAGQSEDVPLVALPASGIIYVNATMTGATAGAASLAVLYLGTPAAPWS